MCFAAPVYGVHGRPERHPIYAWKVLYRLRGAWYSPIFPHHWVNNELHTFAPWSSSDTGIYAFAHKRDAERWREDKKVAESEGAEIVVRVALWGTIIEHRGDTHEPGYRAQHARIVEG